VSKLVLKRLQSSLNKYSQSFTGLIPTPPLPSHYLTSSKSLDVWIRPAPPPPHPKPPSPFFSSSTTHFFVSAKADEGDSGGGSVDDGGKTDANWGA
jgi:hypothetical protein